MFVEIESLRQEMLGASYVWVPKSLQDESPESRIALFFHELSNQATYFTWQAFEELEGESRHFSRPRSGAVPVMLWFVAIEAFVNTVLKILCKLRDIDFTIYRGKGIAARLSVIFEVAEIDRTPVQQQGLWARLGEFAHFRNEILHDRFQHTPLDFHHTVFSPNPYFSNQADDMQAALIANEVFETLRFIITGLDLMPNILIRSESGLGWFKSCDVQAQITIPFFERVLMKHGVTSKVQEQFQTKFSSVPSSALIPEGRVMAIVRAVPSMQNAPKPNSETTSIGRDILEPIRSSISLPTGKFVVPNYAR